MIDVRTVPFSAGSPFQQAGPVTHAQAGRVRYAHVAEEFGARRTDPALLYEAGRVDFDRVRQTKTFREGIERVLAGARQGCRIALVCSEAEPDGSKAELWRRVLKETGAAPNQQAKEQMDVVLSL